MRIPKFLKLIYYVSVIFTLFFGVNVLRGFGYMINDENAPSYQKLFPSFILLLLVYIFMIIFYNNFLKYKAIENKFLLFIVVLIGYLFVSGLTGDIAFVPNTIILPVLFSILLIEHDYIQLKNTRFLIILFFVCNSSLAILENIISVHVFDVVIETTDYSGFRSTALQNHPLNNAIVNSIIMVFILNSDIKNLYKIFLFSLGFISIICFGSRTAIVINSLVVIIYLLKFMINIDSKDKLLLFKKLFVLIMFVIGIFGLLYIITNTSLGERLVNTAYFDDSANVRLEVFDIFEIVGFDNLLFGFSSQATERIREAAGVLQIENFWILWLLRFGLLFSIALIYGFYKFIKNRLSYYSSFESFLILFSFLLIASTNNSLASSTPVISILVLCSYSFLIPFNNKRKYLSHPNSLEISKI